MPSATRHVNLYGHGQLGQIVSQSAGCTRQVSLLSQHNLSVFLTMSVAGSSAFCIAADQAGREEPDWIHRPWPPGSIFRQSVKKSWKKAKSFRPFSTPARSRNPVLLRLFCKCKIFATKCLTLEQAFPYIEATEGRGVALHRRRPCVKFRRDWLKNCRAPEREPVEIFVRSVQKGE
jgi:hypothetical protein